LSKIISSKSKLVPFADDTNIIIMNSSPIDNENNNIQECRLLGCYAEWFLKEPHGVTSQKTAFFIVSTVKT
jgi:hypothetical protein